MSERPFDRQTAETRIPSSPVPRPPARWVADGLRLATGDRVRLAGWGAASLPRLLARKGVRVTVSEPSQAMATWQRAVIARSAAPDETQMNRVVRLSRDPSVVRRFSAWNHRWFSPEETTWLGIWHHHLFEQAWNEEDRDFAIAVVLGTIRTWTEANRDGIQLKSRPPLTMLRLQWEQLQRLRQENPGVEASPGPVNGRPAFVGYVAGNGGTWCGSEPLSLWDGWIEGNPAVDAMPALRPLEQPSEDEQVFWVTSTLEETQVPPRPGAKVMDQISVGHPTAEGQSHVIHTIWLDPGTGGRQGMGTDESGLTDRPARKELDRS
ncbi:MAG: hypothetical protein VKP72_07950 [bacterium]|nr:hypothetical protein [bacterium]